MNNSPNISLQANAIMILLCLVPEVLDKPGLLSIAFQAHT